MRWQRLLGLLLGFFIVGPLLNGLIGRDRVGSFELLLGGIIGAVVGYLAAGKLSVTATDG